MTEPAELRDRSSRVRFEVADWFALRGSIMPLWRAHHAEIARDAAAVPLAPDWTKYDTMARERKLLIVVAKDGEQLVGYAFVIIDTHLHYRSTLCGYFDLYWLKPEYRGFGGAGVKLIVAAEAAGNSHGVVKWFIGSKVWQDHSRLFARLGWTETERLFTKTKGA